MVLIKRETSVNLNLGESNNLGIFNYNASAKENLDKSEALRMVAFQIFRDVQKGRNRETKMKTAIRKHSQILYLTQKSLKEEDRAEFLAKDYRKALRKFIDDLEGMKLSELIQMASDKQYLDEDDENVEQLSKLNLTIGQLGSEGQVRRELQLPLGQMTDEPDDLLGTSLARAMMGNKNLAPPRDYKEIIEHIDIRTEGDTTLLIFRAKDYLHRLLDSNGYMASESTSDNPVVRKGLEYPTVNNKGVRDKKPVDEEEEETEEQRRTREEAEIGRELEADMAIEDDSEGIEVTGEDDNLEDLSDEEFADALTEQTKKVKKLLKAKMGDKLDPDKLDPTGPMESILSFITYKDGTFTLVKPDGTEIKSKSASDIANDGEDVTITKTMLEKILKKPVPSKEEMNPIQRLVFDSLQPSEGEITVKNYSMKLKIAGDTPAVDVYDSVLQLTEAEDPDEFTEDQGKEIKASIRSNLNKFLKELVEFHKLLKTEELKRIFYAADSRKDFIDNMIEFRNIPYVSQDDEDDEEDRPEESLPEEDYREIMARVGMKTRAGKTTTGQPSTYFQSGAASDSPFGKEGAEKIMNTTLDIGDKEQRVALIIPRMRGVTPTVENFADAIYDANFQRKPKDGKIDFTRESAILIPNKNVKLETVPTKYGSYERPKQGQKLSKPTGIRQFRYNEQRYSDDELREMRGSTPPSTRNMVRLISVTEDIKQLAGKPLFVSFRPYKRQRKTTERDITPKKPRYTESLLGILQKVKTYFDRLRTNTKR
mgnify:FL=1|tara:strand:- start:982 stop:3279 length:2298 start_codon:yes stop_codon:yes gene_type:complete